jgi:hypothetical protein
MSGNTIKNINIHANDTDDKELVNILTRKLQVQNPIELAKCSSEYVNNNKVALAYTKHLLTCWHPEDIEGYNIKSEYEEDSTLWSSTFNVIGIHDCIDILYNIYTNGVDQSLKETSQEAFNLAVITWLKNEPGLRTQKAKHYVDKD